MRAFHNKRVGRKVLLYDGRSVVSDDTEIRYLNHHRGEVVVFWTRRDDGRAPLTGLSATSVNSRTMETSAIRSMRADFAASSSSALVSLSRTYRDMSNFRSHPKTFSGISIGV